MNTLTGISPNVKISTGLRVFITGITGTLGTALAKSHLASGDEVLGCSRSEGRAVRWLEEHGKGITHYLADAVDLREPRSAIGKILPSIHTLYHCAAMKHVDLCEKHPDAAIVQNVLITREVTDACQRNGVRCVHVSSDKACLPQGVYGSTKLLSERVALNNGATVVRLGNLIGSSGSVFHRWKEAVTRGEPITLTDPDMTRFFITVEDAVEFIRGVGSGQGVRIPKMKTAKMGDVAECLSHLEGKIIGPRPGESKHQWLIAPGERVLELSSGYILDYPSGADTVTFAEGLNSSRAERWNTRELLRRAGTVR